MPKASKESASQVVDFGAGEQRSEELGGYTVNFVTIRQDQDLAPVLAGLPGGKCACPHWGYVMKGSLTVRYADHEEVITAGESFYMPPGHAPAATAGSEFFQISPTDEMKVTEAAIAESIKRMQNA